ncbi:MAG: putative porin [Verrucomicrobiaceae bacterium]|nr:putative porin [Verrucomicrobiaceae bacterium]
MLHRTLISLLCANAALAQTTELPLPLLAEVTPPPAVKDAVKQAATAASTTAASAATAPAAATAPTMRAPTENPSTPAATSAAPPAAKAVPSPSEPSAAAGADISLEIPPPNGLLPPSSNAPRPPAASISENVTINLINRLVQRGALTKADADDLIKLAEQDAIMAQQQKQALAETQAVVASQNAIPPLEPDKEEVRVTYIPESVKEEIRTQLRSELTAEIRPQSWASDESIPGWTKRFRPYGDIRMRYDMFMFPTGNDNLTGAFPNFNSINTGAPFDLTNAAGTRPPQLNVDQDRERARLRMRLGFDIDLEDGFTAGIRLATGGNNSPVSTNQTLGSTGSGSPAQGGGFSKYELWLDRAFIQYESGFHKHGKLMVWLGRFDNPFQTNSQIMWDEDVGLDGIAFKVSDKITSGLDGFFTAGLFPVFTSYFNFGSNNAAK